MRHWSERFVHKIYISVGFQRSCSRWNRVIIAQGHHPPPPRNRTFGRADQGTFYRTEEQNSQTSNVHANHLKKTKKCDFWERKIVNTWKKDCFIKQVWAKKIICCFSLVYLGSVSVSGTNNKTAKTPQHWYRSELPTNGSEPTQEVLFPNRHHQLPLTKLPFSFHTTTLQVQDGLFEGETRFPPKIYSVLFS